MSPADKQKAQAASTTTEAPSLLDQVISATKPLDNREAERAKNYFKQFLESAVQPGHVVSKDVETNIKYWIGEIDKKLSAQLNEIMHHDDFQKLEGTWRGLHYLIHETPTVDGLRIRVLNATKRELFRDLERASEFDQSTMFKKVYEEEYGQLG